MIPTHTLDLPKGLMLSDLETQVLRKVVTGIRVKDISIQLGIPQSSIHNLLRNEDVKNFVQEMIDARNLSLKMELPSLLQDMIQDKIDYAEEEGLTLGQTTKKDLPDLIKQLSEMLKPTGSDTKADDDGWGKLYQQINVIQGGN